MVGLFAFMTVGTAVVIDLWNLLDIKRGHSIVRRAVPHFLRRQSTDLLTIARGSGSRIQALCCSNLGLDRPPRHRLPLLVLGSLHHSQQEWYWR